MLLNLTQGRSDSPLDAEGGEVQDWADDGERLGVVSQLAEDRPELPAEREQLAHLQCDMWSPHAHDDLLTSPHLEGEADENQEEVSWGQRGEEHICRTLSDLQIH